MDKVVKIEIVRSDTRTLLIDGTDWMIPSDGLDGFGSIEADISTVDNAIGDGAIITTARVSSRDRTIKAEVYDSCMNDIMRHQACAFFNPKMTYKVYLTYLGMTRWCEGVLYKFSCPEKNIYEKVEFSFTILCSNPYLKSYDNFGQNIASVAPMTAFPYLCTARGRPTGRYNFAQRIILENDGDVETFCQAVFKANGEVINPRLEVNGKYVRMELSMQAGDTLMIDFTKQPPTVTLNGENIIGKSDRTSSFKGMGLVIGDSEISFNADSGSSLLDVSIYYNKLYATM